MAEYYIPTQSAQSELVEKRSRFIGQVFVAEDEAQARACIEAARRLLSQMSLGPCEMSMSFGLSMLASRQDLTERAVEAADRRMYQEKRLHHAANA